MRVGPIAFDSKTPNFAPMKLSTYHNRQVKEKQSSDSQDAYDTEGPVPR